MLALVSLPRGMHACSLYWLDWVCVCCGAWLGSWDVLGGVHGRVAACACQFHFPIFFACAYPALTSRPNPPRHVPGTGTFGRVRLVLHKESRKYMALKILKKSEVRGALD